MGLNNTHALGRSERFYVVDEVTPGTQVKPAAANYMVVTKSGIGLEQTNDVRTDKRDTRSALERVPGKSSAPFTAECFLIPSGTAGTPPDAHSLIKAAFGSYANTPATSDVYSLSASQSMPTVSAYSLLNDILSVASKGVWIDSLNIAFSGGDKPKLKFDGAGMGHMLTATSTLNGAPSGADITVQTGDGIKFSVGSIVKVSADDNSGAGFKVLSIVGDVLTLEGSPTALTGADVIPFLPVGYDGVGTPVSGISGCLSVDGSSLPITGFDCTIKNGYKVIDDEACQEFPTDAIPGFREVSGTVSFRARKDLLIYLANAKEHTQLQFVATMGSGAGKTVTLTMPIIEMDFTGIDIPEADEVVLSLPYVALGSSGEDEATLSFT